MDKQELKTDIKDNRTLSRELEKKLKDEFEKVIDNPTDKQIKKYREVEEVLLALWLKDVMSNMIQGINDNISIGKATALAQLKKKGFKKVLDKSKDYKDLSNAQKQLVRADLEKIVANIKANSRRNILDIQEAFIKQKKKLTKGFLQTFRKYGIAYFTDRRGARWTLERYVNMATTTVLANANRQAFFMKSVEMGNDLVKVYHIGLTPECPLCAPFTGKVLSITGRTKGYLTVDEAKEISGHLFSYNCDHDVQSLELAPEKEDGDNIINPTDQLKKRMQNKNIKNKLISQTHS
jgi:hypothetical protein